MTESLPQFKPNDEVEGLRIVSKLGEGAASVIYLAQDPKNKQVWALKHVHRGSHKDDRFLQQAIYEYKVATDLDHPNIRKIFRLEKKRKGLLQLTDVFLVMEMLDGVPLDKRPPRTFEEAVSMFLQIADALRHMHQRGYVHADMKPNNVMMVPGTVAKLIDLGQSCREGTVKSRIQGTPDYIAPEQVHRRAITAKTDVYNLGATMYALLTGRTVPTALPKGDALVGRLDDHMVPKPKPANELNPKIPQMLTEVIMQSVEIDPTDRPTMTYVAERLQLILGVLRAKSERGNAEPAKPTGNSSSSTVGLIYNEGSSAMGLKVPEPGQPPTGQNGA